MPFYASATRLIEGSAQQTARWRKAARLAELHHDNLAGSDELVNEMDQMSRSAGVPASVVDRQISDLRDTLKRLREELDLAAEVNGRVAGLSAVVATTAESIQARRRAALRGGGM